MEGENGGKKTRALSKGTEKESFQGYYKRSKKASTNTGPIKGGEAAF